VREPDGELGQWYLHTFAPEQPDVDWSDEEVQRTYDDVVRFWLDRGVDGIRVDAAPAMAKAPGLPDAGHAPGARFDSHLWQDSPHWDVDEVHAILRRWRAIGDGYAGDRLFVSEAIVHSPERLSQYVRPDEMHTTFNFDFLHAPWRADRLRQVIDATRAALAPTGAPPTWVLSSHDEPRQVTRYGRDQPAERGGPAAGPTDVAVGLRRARAAALLLLALPGGAYLYQGEELGLPEVEDLPADALQDPTWERSGHTVRGRDGCRVPLPWSGDAPPFHFTGADVQPWLPQPAGWADVTMERQHADPTSTLSLYRAALRLRRELAGLAGEELTWDDDAGGSVLAFSRGAGFGCLVNLGAEPVDLAGRGDVLIASGAVTDQLPTDTAVWLRTP
jgi:alpha-glucosidase